jgi:hypothetical protein
MNILKNKTPQIINHMTDFVVQNPIHLPNKITTLEEIKESKNIMIELKCFKWCNCHIYLSSYDIYPDICFRDCSLYPNDAHMLETRREFVTRMTTERAMRKERRRLRRIRRALAAEDYHSQSC